MSNNGTLKYTTDQRRFTMVYNDFLESDKLNCQEKMVYITIKRFADYGTGQAFPSLKKIAKVAHVGLSTVQRSVKHLQELGVLTIEHRVDDENGALTSNLYTLRDYAWMWNDTEADDQAELDEDARAIARLRARGYTVIPGDQSKEKVTEFDASAGEPSPEPITNPNLSKENYSQTEPGDQDRQDDFSVEVIRQRYDYDDLLIKAPADKAIIDMAMDVIYAVYHGKGRVRVGGVQIPAKTVRERYDDLMPDDILYAIQKLREQKKPIRQQPAYLRTILYNAKSQQAMEHAQSEAATKEPHDMLHGMMRQAYDDEAIEKAILPPVDIRRLAEDDPGGL